MFLVRIVNGNAPVVTVVGDLEERLEWINGMQVAREVPRQPFARRIVGGAAALGHKRHEAIAAAKVIIEELLLEQQGRTYRPIPGTGMR